MTHHNSRGKLRQCLGWDHDFYQIQSPEVYSIVGKKHLLKAERSD
jgi:hypothetical protein